MDLQSLARHIDRWRRVEEQLAEVLGSWIAAAPPGACEHLAAQAAQHAWHAELWAQRHPEIGLASAAPAPSDRHDAETRELLAPLTSATTTAARFGALYLDVLPRLVAEYRALRDATDERLDAPTVRVLTLILRDDEESLAERERLNSMR